MVGLKRRFSYCTTKDNVSALTRQPALDYATEMRVNCICPGTIDTPIIDNLLEKHFQGEQEKVREEMRRRQPIGRLGTAGEIARSGTLSGVGGVVIHERCYSADRWCINGYVD